MVWVIPVASPYESFDVRLTASVLDGPSMKPIPAPDRMIGRLHPEPKLSFVTFSAHR